MQRKTTLLTLVFASILGSAAAAFTGCTSLLGDFEVAGVEASEAGSEGGAKANGAVCSAGAECGSGFCADGVCCESACSGTCESCGIDKGKCVPVPDGQDPDKECKGEPRPDAGMPPEPDAGPITDGGADANNPDATVAQEDGGGRINFPEAGVMQADDKCAGSCNGARACKFPGKEVGCGTKFCNTSSEAAKFACDSKGHCELGLETCKSFSCENDECRTSCAEQNDCQDTDFCNQQGKCQPKQANGLGCGLSSHCKSGFCVVTGGTGVCCNSECDPAQGIPGASCKVPGSEGKCQCSVNCGAGSCRLFYRDFDLDGYGDKLGSVATNTAVVGCDNAAPPAGYSASKDDCDDGDGRAHPGQTGWFADKTVGKGLNDFNCDGIISKELREYPGATCYVCGPPQTCAKNTTCPANSTQQSRLNCDLYQSLVFCLPGSPCPSQYTCGYGKFAYNIEGFTASAGVGCGDNSNTYKTCGACPGSASVTFPSSSTTTKQQRCH
jgi:hypothetical protein